MGWLNAIPDKSELSNRDMLHEGSPALDMPDCGRFKYLTHEFRNIGMADIANGTPVTWSEIEAYCSDIGSHLNGWDKQQLRNMSISYVAAKSEAKNPDVGPPHNTQEFVDFRIKQQLSALEKTAKTGFI